MRTGGAYINSEDRDVGSGLYQRRSPRLMQRAMNELSQQGITPENTAKAIAEAATAVSSRRVVLLGRSAKRPSQSSPWSGTLQQQCGVYHLEDEGEVNMHMQPRISLQMEGHKHLDVHLSGRGSHILLVNCENLNIEISTAPLAGIYMLRCAKCTLTISGECGLPSLGLENCESISLYLTLQQGFLLTNYGSISVSINGSNTRLNPLEHGSWILTSRGGHYHRLVHGSPDPTFTLLNLVQ